MSDTNERSVASAGSVADEPVAWAVMVGGQRMYVSWCKEMCEDEAYYHRHPCGDSVLVVPLYRQLQDGVVVQLPRLLWGSSEKMGTGEWDYQQRVKTALEVAGVKWAVVE